MTLTSAAIALFLVLNPLGNIPLFLSELKNVTQKRYNYIIVREVFIAFLILIAFMFFGQYVLYGFQISTEALGIAGGIILFLIALRMTFPAPKDKTLNADEKPKSEPFIVPLAIPITAGPASLTTVILFVSTQPDKKLFWFTIISIASFGCLLVTLSARYLSKILGERGIIAMERLMGMILTAISVQMFLTGLTTYFRLH
jgi:multiple antibiotic resistance protein